MPAAECVKRIDRIPGFRKQVEQAARKLAPDLAGNSSRDGAVLMASVAEFLLDGLHCHNRLNKKQTTGGASYGL